MAPCPRPRADTSADDVSDAARDGASSLRRTRPALTGTVTYTAVVRSSRVVLNDERVQLHIKHIVSNSKVRKVQHTTVNDQTVNMKT